MQNEVVQKEDGLKETRAVGRGALWIAAAKGYFIFTGLMLLTLLPRYIGKSEVERADLYGLYTVVMGILNPITMMMIAGTLQSVSKFISEDPSRYASVRRQAVRLQLVFDGIVTVALAASAPLISWLLNDPRLTVYIQASAPIVFCYSLYAVFIGTFNGRRLFFRQASMDIMFATLKVGLIVLLAILGFGVYGAIGGFLITAVIMLLVSSFLARGGEYVNSIGWRRLIAFQFWIMIFTLLMNLFINADLYMVKAFLADWVADGREAKLAALLGVSASEVSNSLVGIYSVAVQVARLPYIGVIAVSLVLFPLVSKETYQGESERTSRIITDATRYTLLMASLFAIGAAACAGDILKIVFTPIFVHGRVEMAMLAIGYLSFSMLMIFTTVASGSGKPQVSAKIMGVMLVASGLFNILAVSHFGTIGAAFASAIVMTLGAFAAWLWIARRFNVSFPLRTLLRCIVAAIIAFGISFSWQPDSKPLLVVKGAVVGIILLAILIRDLSREELLRFKSIVVRNRK